jgi:putative lumazine-binding protein
MGMEIRNQEVTAADLESIERAATDYIEAWLTGDAERMADCLHADLTKRSIDIDATSGGHRVNSLTYRDMVDATRAGRGASHPRGYVVSILEAFRNVATAKVDSAAYVDYLHIGRFEDRWRIINVLWEPRTRD